MKKTIAILILFFGLTLNLLGQNTPFNIVEVFLGTDTIETFDYELIILSGQDTLRPHIEEKYFLPVLSLDSTVSIIVKTKNKTITVHDLNNYYLSGFSTLEFRVNPEANDSCVNLIRMSTCLIETRHDSLLCKNYHEVFLTRFHESGIMSFENYFLMWKYRKKTRDDWWKSINSGTSAGSEKRNEH